MRELEHGKGSKFQKVIIMIETLGLSLILASRGENFNEQGLRALESANIMAESVKTQSLQLKDELHHKRLPPMILSKLHKTIEKRGKYILAY